MNVQDPITLSNQGRWLDLATLGCDAWNAWADNELKKPLEQRAAIDFSECEITHTDFDGFKFPGSVRFEAVKFKGNTFFSRALFFGEVRFDDSQFDHATFQYARFSARASFRCVFSGASSFL